MVTSADLLMDEGSCSTSRLTYKTTSKKSVIPSFKTVFVRMVIGVILSISQGK